MPSVANHWHRHKRTNHNTINVKRGSDSRKVKKKTGRESRERPPCEEEQETSPHFLGRCSAAMDQQSKVK